MNSNPIFQQIEFNHSTFKRFKAFYKEAMEKGNEDFMFLQKPFMTAYAKYLIEYLEPKFKTNRKK